MAGAALHDLRAVTCHRSLRTAPGAVFRANGAFRPPTCIKGHTLTIVLCRVGSQICDYCEKNVRSTFTHRCAICDYDLCGRCFETAEPEPESGEDEADAEEELLRIPEEPRVQVRPDSRATASLSSTPGPAMFAPSLQAAGTRSPSPQIVETSLMTPWAPPLLNTPLFENAACAVPLEAFETGSLQTFPAAERSIRRPPKRSPLKGVAPPRLEALYGRRSRPRQRGISLVSGSGRLVLRSSSDCQRPGSTSARGAQSSRVSSVATGNGCASRCLSSAQEDSVDSRVLTPAVSSYDELCRDIVANSPQLTRSDAWFMEVMGQVVRSAASPYGRVASPRSSRAPSQASRSRPHSVSGGAAGTAFMWQPADPSRLEKHKVALPDKWQL